MPARKDNENSQVRKAGQALTKLRTDVYKYDQREVEARTGGRVIAQQISKLENGSVARPSMRDLVELGRIYGMTPNQMAELYGYWTPTGDDEQPDDPRITILRDTAKKLPPVYRERLLNAAEVSSALFASEAERAHILETTTAANRQGK